MTTITKPARILSVGDILVIDDRRLAITAVVVGSVVSVTVADASAKSHSFFFPLAGSVQVAV
jgi:uncharacterized Zn finger protein